MGNQPSSSAATGTTPVSSPPPPPPVCDAPCQRQKKLDGLKTALDQATLTRDSNPEGYEEARVAYFTELHGQGWLAKEKEKIARDEIAPVTTDYSSRYKSLTERKGQNQVFTNLVATLKNDQADNEEELKFLDKHFNKEKNEANVLNRLTELNPPSAPVSTTNYLPIILDAVIALLGLIVFYFLYSKMNSIGRYFGYGNDEAVSNLLGGRKRV